MIPVTKRQWAAIKAASKNRLDLASASDYVLTIDGKDLTRYVDELKIPDQDGPGVVLDGGVGAMLPTALEGTECKLEYLVGGERIPAYLGEVDFVVSGAYESSFLAGTPSRYAPKTPIGEDASDNLTYSSVKPSQAMYEAAARMGYAGIEIPLVDKPLFTRVDPFRWTDSIADIYDALKSEAKLVPEDTPLGVLTARVDGSVLGDSEPAWVVEEGVDFDFGDLTVKSREEGRYARVVAWNSDASGVHRRLATAKVDNQGRKVRQDATDFLELTDEAVSTAHEAVYRRAIELADNAQTIECPVVYPPFFLTRNDPVLVRGREITPTGTWVREYRARLTSVSTDVYKRTGSLKAVGGLLSEVFVPRKKDRDPPRSGAARASYGFDHLERLYVPEDWASLVPGAGVVVRAGDAALQGVGVILETGRGVVIYGR